MNPTYPKSIKDLPLNKNDITKSFKSVAKKAKKKLLQYQIEVKRQKRDDHFKISRGKETIFSKIIIVPTDITHIHIKTESNFNKHINACIIYADLTCEQVTFDSSELDYRPFRKKLDKVYDGIIPLKHCNILLDIFELLSTNITITSKQYIGEGLTFDHKHLIYKETKIPVGKVLSASQEEREISKKMFKLFLDCCPKDKAMLLLMIQFIGLSFEIIKKLEPYARRKCLPTVVPYIYGKSGSGKTTLCKAFYDGYSDGRYVEIGNATIAAIPRHISKLYGGIYLIDDMSHETLSNCSKADLKKLEAIIRTYGDNGAEKMTAYKKFDETNVWVVATGEDLFSKIESSVLRLMPIKLQRGETNFKLTEQVVQLTSQRKTFYTTYLKWLVTKLECQKDLITDIPTLSQGYDQALNEVYEDYVELDYARVVDNHAHMICWFDFITDFLKLIDLSDAEISALRAGIKQELKKSADSQYEKLNEQSLEYYIKEALSELVYSGQLGTFESVGSPSNVKTSGENVLAYYNKNVIMMVTSQKKGFMNSVKSKLPGQAICDKEIINALLVMGCILDPRTENVLDSWDSNHHQLKVNDIDTRILKIKYEFNKENYYE